MPDGDQKINETIQKPDTAYKTAPLKRNQIIQVPQPATELEETKMSGRALAAVTVMRRRTKGKTTQNTPKTILPDVIQHTADENPAVVPRAGGKF